MGCHPSAIASPVTPTRCHHSIHTFCAQMWPLPRLQTGKWRPPAGSGLAGWGGARTTPCDPQAGDPPPAQHGRLTLAPVGEFLEGVSRAGLRASRVWQPRGGGQQHRARATTMRISHRPTGPAPAGRGTSRRPLSLGSACSRCSRLLPSQEGGRGGPGPAGKGLDGKGDLHHLSLLC